MWTLIQNPNLSYYYTQLRKLTSLSGHIVCFEITASFVKMNGLKTDFEGSGVAVNQWTLGDVEDKVETYKCSCFKFFLIKNVFLAWLPAVGNGLSQPRQIPELLFLSTLNMSVSLKFFDTVYCANNCRPASYRASPGFFSPQNTCEKLNSS